MLGLQFTSTNPSSPLDAILMDTVSTDTIKIWEKMAEAIHVEVPCLESVVLKNSLTAQFLKRAA